MVTRAKIEVKPLSSKARLGVDRSVRIACYAKWPNHNCGDRIGGPWVVVRVSTLTPSFLDDGIGYPNQGKIQR